MNKKGPIIVIEDDLDDQFILSAIFKDLDYKNEVVFFSDAMKALEYLTISDNIPFLILSDVNMPKVGGFELRNKIQSNEHLSIKCIPFIFFTTAISKGAVIDAYSMSAQGFFIKPTDYESLQETIKAIVTYWQKCYSPMSVFEQP